ncbi:MAG: hypothetical protein LBQ06_02025 [Frankiaceae bacterium]|jgi:nitroreductase|nr:hypothetical protein [Frankiaceae bacterium]
MSEPRRASHGHSALDGPGALAAVRLAVRAPSIHNTQPWRWSLDPSGVLRLHADWSRRLAVADPDGHSLMISCGAAVQLTALGLEAQGWDVAVDAFPDATDSSVLAAFRVAPNDGGDAGAPARQARSLAEAALDRRSDRRPLLVRQIADADLESLRQAGNPDAWIDFPHGEDQRVNLAVAVSWADRQQANDEAYVAEMRRWLRDPEVHAPGEQPADDGVPTRSIPHVDPGHPRRLDIPQRDFEAGMSGGQIIERDVDEKPLIAVVFAPADSPRDQLLAGRSMMRFMLRAHQLGLATCPLSQAVDLGAFRSRVQGLMGWVGRPEMMLRVGYPSRPLDELPRTPRRAPADVLDIAA